MHISGTLIDKFDTSLGLIVVIGFFENFIPSINMIIISQTSGSTWKVFGIGQNRALQQLEKYSNLHYESIWDIQVEGISANKKLKKGDKLDFMLGHQ